ncbi:MAG: phytanoyl-CoA dioxygenase family protein [Fimbriimonadaceae bacterium]|nr:phytanoyl-CoA dioxygenase family protein [Fimbriimonadaceae bacterium]
MSVLVTAEQIAQFERDGYLLLPGLFEAAEMALLLQIGKADQAKLATVSGRLDKDGGVSKLWLTGELGEDMYSAIVRCPRVAGNMDRLLGGEVYHYHHKMMTKEPFVGGAWEWHQDYGYWYHNGCLFPDLASCMIAVDRASRENGCLQVIRGSHRLGRIEHGKSGEQTGADEARVAWAEEHLELVHCEMEPGTALFFHSNLLHRSDQNRSPHPRWTLICCYNRADNPCRDLPGHPSYRPLERWSDDRVRELGEAQWAALAAGPA